MRIKNFIIVILSFVFVNGYLNAQKVGTTSMQFLKVIPEARGTGMAEAIVSVSTGISSIFWNPAGLSECGRYELEFGYINWIFDTYQTSVACGFGIRKLDLGVGFQFQYIDFGKIEETRVDYLGFVEETGLYNPGVTGRVYNPKAWVIGLSFAKLLTDKFSVGLGVKYAMEMLWSEKTVTLVNPAGFEEQFNTYGRALLFDFGVSYKTGFRTVKVGASVQNFGPQIKYAKEKFPAPLTFRLGISGYIIGQGALLVNSNDIGLLASYDIMHPNDYDQQMHFGFELNYKDVLYLRMGKKMNYDVENLTFGVGVNLSTNQITVEFNYSYLPLDKYLGKTHKISVGIKSK